MAAVLFMWVVMPAFGAAAYVPSITLGEWAPVGLAHTIQSVNTLSMRALH
jgi:hypothetical protein